MQDCTEAVVVIASDDGLLRVFSTVTWTCVATCRDPQNGMRIVQLTSYRYMLSLLRSPSFLCEPL